MNLLITIDKNYLSQVKIMLHSVRWANPGVELQVYLLHSSLSPAHCKELKNFLLRQDIQLHSIEINDQELDNAPVTSRYPKEMYYRIFAARYLPSNIDRVLYLDPDLVVINSLEQLYQTPMEGYYFAAATHVKGFFRKLNQLRLEEYEDGPYINSGVMLMNLTLLRKKQNFSTVIHFLEKHQTGLLLPDQDLLSGLYGPHILLLDEYRYNMTERLFFFRPEAEAFWDLDWVRQNSAIIHYCGRNKPWKKNYIGKLDIFYEEAAQRLDISQAEKNDIFLPPIKPPKLSCGDTIAIVAPCSACTIEQAMETKNALEQLGFSVSLSPNLCSNAWDFAATLEERASDFQQAVLDDRIKMVFFGGGEVGNQLLPYLDYESIRQHPKIYCSYSDGTSILNAIYCRTGLVTFYGNSPARMSPPTPYGWACFQKQLMKGQASYEKASQWITVTPGKARGILIGGYLLNFALMQNSGYFSYCPGKNYLLFLEDSLQYNAPAAVARYLSHLEQTEFFSSVCGLIVGSYDQQPCPQLFSILKRLGEQHNIPIIKNDDFGHGEHHALFPIGIEAELDADRTEFRFLESGITLEEAKEK